MVEKIIKKIATLNKGNLNARYKAPKFCSEKLFEK